MVEVTMRLYNWGSPAPGRGFFDRDTLKARKARAGYDASLRSFCSEFGQ